MAPKKSPRNTPTPTSPSEVTVTGQLPAWTNNAFVAGVVILCATILWTRLDRLDTRMGNAEVELGKVKQRIADGGTQEIVSALRTSGKPGEVSATLALISAQVQLAKAQSKAPNQSKINELAPAVVAATEKYPQTDQAWETVSDLASYRTASVVVSPNAELPVCESHNAIPELRDPSGLSYDFHDCRLLLDRLPGKSMPNYVTNGPPGMTGPILIGYPAYLKNVTIELGPDGISDTNIIRFFAENCRFDFRVQHTPDAKTQRLLIAALQTKEPGSGQLAL